METTDDSVPSFGVMLTIAVGAVCHRACLIGSFHPLPPGARGAATDSMIDQGDCKVATMRKEGLLLGVASIALLLAATPAPAQTLGELLPELLKSEDRVRAAESDLAASRERHEVAFGEYYPEGNFTGWYGPQYQNKSDVNDTFFVAKQFQATVTQLVHDFGKTDGKIEIAKQAAGQADVALGAAKQNVTLDAVTAYVNVMRAAESLRYARMSEDNIRKQTGYEEARVEAGGGYSTDVLQAKTQLAGAQARRVRAEGSLVAALNRYRNMFGAVPPKVDTMRWPASPNAALPESVDAAYEVAKNSSLVLKNEELKEQTARSEIGVARAGFYPRIELVAEHSRKADVDALAGLKTESLGKVQVKLPINLGLTAINSLNAAENAANAATFRLRNIREAVEEQVRNSWQNLLTARENAGFLRNQANISAEFLELARKERQLGTRSLLDVLSGETTYINALSEAIAAEADVLLASFQLLAAMGQLDPELAMRTASAPPANPVATLSGRRKG